MPRHSSAALRAQALDAALRRLFRMLEARPTPDVFRIMMAQLTDPTPSVGVARRRRGPKARSAKAHPVLRSERAPIF
jgi:hypothetical protein